MILYRCPLRIGIAGGSTDLESFIQHNGHGAVINFPTNLYTYVMVHKDLMGLNSLQGKYVVNYSQREECSDENRINNDIARLAVKNYYKKPCNITMTSDISSSGSGLASSSSYMISSLMALSKMEGKELSKYDCCKKAMELEREFNPLLGYQDSFGCGIGGLKKMDFCPGRDPVITYLSSDIFNKFDMYLINTCMDRSSTKILDSIETKDNKDLGRMLEIVEEMQKAIEDSDEQIFFELIKEGYQRKKNSSPHIFNSVISDMEDSMLGIEGIKAIRLCGAGGGGYILVFADKDKPRVHEDMEEMFDRQVMKIGIDEIGVRSLL